MRGAAPGPWSAVALLLAVLLAMQSFACAPALSRSRHSPAELRGRIAPTVDGLLDSRPLHRAFWGVLFVDARTGQVLYERNAHRHFVPASTMKLVVAATALARLGPDYTYRTSLYTNGEIRDGELAGDLILYGRGDPNISGRYAGGPTAIFSALADSLEARGVQRVAGAVIADESYFDADYTRPDWEAYDLLWWYAAPVSALSFNDNSIDFTIRPTSPGSPPEITAVPVSDFYSLSNTARTVEALDSTSVKLDFTRLPGTNRIIAYGEVPASAKEETESFAVVNPAAYTAAVFRETLEAEGIPVADDSVRVVSDPAPSPVGASSILLAEHVSPPLERVVASINRRSQNLHAEQLLKTLGKEVRGEGSFDAGISVEREFLRSIGIEPDAVEIRDASGLSNGNLLTPEALVRLLRYMLTHPHGELFFASLPTAGDEGSLRFRFTDSPVAEAVHAKTGSIRHVNSLAGYLAPTPADTVVFAIFANNHGLKGEQTIAAIDSTVSIVVRALRR